jgi:hypothetical protein
MSLLRILRNVAVLVILTVAALSLNPRPVAAQSSCRPLGWVCGIYTSKCCPGTLCGRLNRCCNKPFYSMACTRSDVCCTGICYIFPGKSYGRCE